jgi:DNA-binding transcriptional MerR regulator
MQTKRAFTTKELSEILGIYPKTLGYWVTKGVLTPEVYASRGKGTTRLFSPVNVYQALLIKTLSDENFPLERIRNILLHFEEEQVWRRIVGDPQHRSGSTHLVLAENFDKRSEYIDVVDLDEPDGLESLRFFMTEMDIMTLVNLSFLHEWVPRLIQLGVRVDSHEDALGGRVL